MPVWRHRLEEQILNSDPAPRRTAAQQLAALLKILAREAIRSTTECPPAAIPLALARLKDLDSLIDAAIRLDLADEPEAEFSDPAPTQAHTLADYRLAIECTRQQLRGPAFISSTQAELAEITRRLDLLAGMLANTNPAA